jgi:hypothetical protein
MAETVNRSLADPAMDDIDHALGRPLDPMAETYRDYYALPPDDPLVGPMLASGHWRQAQAIPGGLVYLRVTTEGRAALVAHLRAIGDPHRRFTVTTPEVSMTEIARSADNARYSAFLRLRDVMPDLTFLAFCRTARVALSDKEPAHAR